MSNERYQKPKTIEELKAFCEEKGMPLEKMRFFIGEDYSGAKAFGIYQADDGDFVVYKNKADGTRAVRYKGPDEGIAVNELYEKLKAETEMRRQKQGSTGYRRSSGGGQQRSGSYDTRGGQYDTGYPPQRRSAAGGCLKYLVFIMAGLFAVSIAVSLVGSFFIKPEPRPSRGYYKFQDRNYYYYNDDWYYYDDYYDDWYYIDEVDPLLAENYDEYYYSNTYDEGAGYSDFTESDYYDYLESYYDDEDDYDWDWDDDYDYDYDDDWDSGWDDWDSGDSDWDSDW